MDLKDLLWHYNPSLALCIIALVLFTLSALTHIFQLIKYKQKFFIFFVLGTIFQIIGYLGRLGFRHIDGILSKFAARSIRNGSVNSKNYFVIQTLFILLAPIFYAVSIYSMLGKIMQYIGASDLSPIRPTRITCIFVVGDLISFFLQAVGGSMYASNDDDDLKTARYIILIGLIIQLIFFFFFIFLTYVFHSRTKEWRVKENEGNWKRLLYTVEASSLLIFIRSIYRVVQYAQGFDGYLISHEVFLYVLDALLMLTVQILFSFVHPGTVFNVKKTEVRDIENGRVSPQNATVPQPN